jgi:arsenate reductase
MTNTSTDTWTIFHNPACSTSRFVLAQLRDAGLAPRVVAYLDAPPDRATLAALVARLDGGARALLRAKELPKLAETGVALALGEDADESALIDAMLAHPVLIERPLVVGPHGVTLCRPKERVLELLPPR